MSKNPALGTELGKLFENVDKTAATNKSWEDMLIDNARRVSTPFALQMLKQMGLGEDTTAPFTLFENACGPGVVAPALQQTIKPDVLKQSSILCGDFSEPSVGLVKKRIDNEGWINTEAKRIDGQKTSLADGQFTHVVTSFGYHVIPDSEAALDETIRILKPGGLLGFTTWHKEPGWADEVKEAFATFPFEAPCTVGVQATPWGRWHDVNWVRRTLEAKGIQDVKVNVFAHLTRADDAEHFMSHFSMMIDWIMNSCWSAELRSEHPRDEVHGLLKKHLESKYGGKPWETSWIGIIASGRV